MKSPSQKETSITDQHHGKKLIRLVRPVLLMAFFSTSFFSAYSQSIGMTGAPCAGSDIVFYLAGSCSGTTWSLSSGTITSGQGTSSIHATFSAAGSPTVTASSTCNGVFNYYYYHPTIGATVTPTASLVVSPTSTCLGSNITFTASGTNGGSPTYAFYVDGTLKQSGASATYPTSSLAAGSHSAYVVMTSSLSCVTSTSATSSTQSFTVNAPVSYTASVTGPSTICSGSPSAGFSASVSTTYGTLSYQWYLNGSPAGTNSNLFTTSIAQGNTVYCVVSSNYGCINQPVTSNTYTVNLTTSVTPTVQAQVSPLTYCAGSTINLTAPGSNISGSPTYSWKLNGTQFATTASTSLVASYTNVAGYYYPGSSVTVDVTGISGTCLTSTSASGTAPALTINPMVTPTASLSLSTSNSCQGSAITFTASGTNGGSPTYNFFIDGASVQNTSSSSYPTSGLSAGSHSSYVIMTSSLTNCMTSTTATSSTQNFTVTAKASYTVTLNGPSLICSTSPSAGMHATVTNAVGNLSYVWSGAGGTTTTVPDYTFPSVSNGNTLLCTVSSDYWCVNQPVASNTYPVNITNSVTPTVQPQVTPLTYCSGSTISLSTSGTNISGSPTYSWKLNGTQFATTASTSLVASYTNVAGYYYPSSSVTVDVTGISGTCLTSTSASGTAPALTINPMVTPTASLSLSTSNSCQGSAITFTASGTNGGSPTYNFFIDGASVQNTSSSSYPTSGLSAGSHSSYVIMTSSLTNCMTSTTATSSTQNFTVTAPVSYTASVTGPSTICSGSPSAGFSASVSTTYGTLSYQWYLNGSPAGTNSNIFTTTVSQGNTVYCKVTSNYWCITSQPVTSNTYTVNLTNSVTPTVQAQVSPLMYCAGSTINLTAPGSNISGSPTYSWKLNGTQFATTASTSLVASYTNVAGYYYPSSSVTVDVTGISGTCLTSTSASGTAPALTINPMVTPTASLSLSTSNSCQGSAITFTASGTNGGSPTYNFFIDGASVQNTSSSSYPTSGLSAGSHSSYVIMTSSLTNCMTSTTATSSTQNFTVTAPVSYTASVTGPSTICSGSPSAGFSASVSTTYGTLSYQWYLNGSPAGTNSNIFTTTVSQGNTVYCKVTSNYWCITSQPVTSNTYTVNLTNSVTPTVQAQVSPLTYCAGSTINLTAPGSNISGSPTYSWKLNGTQFATTASTSLVASYTNVAGYYYPSSSVTVDVTGISGTCLTSTSASGTAPALTINPMVTPTASLSLSTSNSCQGSAITFTASGTNGGSPTYNFFIDGASVQNTSSSSYPTSGLSAGSHSSYVIMTSSLTNCMTSTTATSSTQNFTVTAKASYTVTLNGPSLICSTSPSAGMHATVTNAVGNLSYVWSGAGGTTTTVPDYTFPSVSNGNTLLCTVSSDYWCVNQPVASNTYPVNITNSVTPTVQPQVTPLTYCSGSTISLSTSGTNISGSPTYSWKLNGTQFATTASTSLVASYTNVAGYYYPSSSVTVDVTGISGTCLTSTSASGTAPALTIYAPTVTGTLESIPSSFCSNGSVTLSVTLNTGSITRYMVRSQDNGSSWTAWTSTTSAPNVTTSAGINRTYNFQAFVQNGTCAEVGANVVSTTVYQNTSAGTLSVDQSSLCNSGSVSLTVSGNVGSITRYLLRTQDNGGAWSSWSTTTSAPSLSTTADIIRNYQFQAFAQNGICSEVGTATVSTMVYPSSIGGILSSTNGTTFCDSGTINLTVTGYSGTISGWYYQINDGSGYGSPVLFSSANSSTNSYVITTSGTINRNYKFYMQVQNGTCSTVNSNMLVATIGAIPTAAASFSTALFSGQPTNIVITNPNYVSGTVNSWTVNQTNVTGASNSSGDTITQVLSTTALATGTATYTITPATSYCSGTPTVALVNIYPLPLVVVSQTYIVKGANITMDVGAGYDTYSWHNSTSTEVATTQTYSTNVPDTYSVTVTKSGATATPSSILITTQLAGVNANYVVTNNTLIGNLTDPGTINNLPTDQVIQHIQYVDGLGRPIQTVATQGSPLRKDIIQPMAYDPFGRQPKKYLPYVDPDENNGWFKENALKDPSTTATTELAMYQSGKQFSFYQTGGLIASDLSPYAETRLNPDPLNRVVKQGAPGAAWQPDATDDYTSIDHTIKSGYETNADNEVKLWTYTPPTATTPIGIITTSYYAANQLYKTKTKDEQQHEVFEFKNKEGKTILKKVQAPGSTWAETYYIYDDAGNLVVVLPPEAVKSIGTN